LESRLVSIFSRILNIDDKREIFELNRINCENWDSLVTMQLIVTLEEVFDIRFDSRDLDFFDSYDGVCSMVKKKLETKSNGR
jgi:acyl carrier protein